MKSSIFGTGYASSWVISLIVCEHSITCLFLWLSSLVTTTGTHQSDVDGLIIRSDRTRWISHFINILSLELYFLDVIAIGLQSCERLQNKCGLPLSISAWNLWLLIYTGTTDLLSWLLLRPSSHARDENIAADVCWLEILGRQVLKKFTSTFETFNIFCWTLWLRI